MELLVDMSLLGMSTALAHYAFGLVGLAALVVVLALVEHGHEVGWLVPTQTKRMLASRRRTMVKSFDRQATWQARMVEEGNDIVSDEDHGVPRRSRGMLHALEAAANVESDDEDSAASSTTAEPVLTR
ncbi:hypothetical protein P43SY_009131 [Pythium insidiosum]|uniref:Uncharacterized protein n=1 Tax=Pythium insidiosum TaxID=114742 RepID=A0AAD5M9F2_PYTIN|nr:hypothetical protein P43SY_009131 [Pythium insidiosum]